MDFLLPNQKPDLARWRNRRFWPAAERGPTPHDAQDMYDRLVGEEAPGPPVDDGPYSRLAAAIMRYDVFPRRILVPVIEREPLQVGDLVGGIAPFALGIRMFFASRVIAVVNAEEGGIWRTGFTYRTLEGHPELGEETFVVEKDTAEGEVRVRLSSWSRPGHWISRAMRSRVRRVQVHANKQALEHLEEVARE